VCGHQQWGWPISNQHCVTHCVMAAAVTDGQRFCSACYPTPEPPPLHNSQTTQAPPPPHKHHTHHVSATARAASSLLRARVQRRWHPGPRPACPGGGAGCQRRPRRVCVRPVWRTQRTEPRHHARQVCERRVWRVVGWSRDPNALQCTGAAALLFTHRMKHLYKPNSEAHQPPPPSTNPPHSQVPELLQGRGTGRPGVLRGRRHARGCRHAGPQLTRVLWPHL
jgi:hypothetical protein